MSEQKLDNIFVFPVTYSQNQLWFLNQMHPQSPAYNIPFAFHLKGSLDSLALKRSINAIINRHETFRTTFADIAGQLSQMVCLHLEIDIPIHDWSENNPDESEIIDYVQQYAVRPFDLERGPLINAQLLKLADEHHILLLNFHHIIIDHVSIGQFAHELNEFYISLASHRPLTLADAKLHYADYSVWQEKYQTKEYLSSQLKYWLQSLGAAQGILELPTDFLRPAINVFQGAEIKFSFSIELLEKLRKFSQKQGVSVFVTVLAAYKVLLHQYTNQSEIIVGCPFANRGHQVELEQVMGCFINTVPLLTMVDKSQSFEQLLKKVRQAVLGANAHQSAPFEHIVEALKPKRDASRNPLFQTNFTLQEPPMQLKLDGLQVESMFLHNYSSKFDTFIWLWESEDGLKGLLEYNTQLFHQDSMQKLLAQYQYLLNVLISHADQPIHQQALVAAPDIQLYESINNTQKAHEDISVLEYILATAKAHPQQICLLAKDGEFTYQELIDSSKVLSSYLQQMGVTTETRIGLCLERSSQMIIAVLGVWLANATYVPLDPNFPRARLDYMIDDAQLLAVISDQSVIFDESIKQIDINAVLQQPLDNKHLVQIKMPKLNQSAYMIYTSGSTGKPKGVVIEHQALTNFIQSMAKHPGITQDDRLLAVTTLSFDISGLELYLPLMMGAKVVLASYEQVNDGEKLRDLIQQHNITMMQATPATWRLLLEVNLTKPLKVLCGGEALDQALANELISKGHQLWNMYGPTETTIWSSCTPITALMNSNTAPLGAPIANTTFYVLDDYLNPVLPGVIGELYIGGHGLSRGYWQRPGLTAERFIPNPFNGKSGTRLYKTGDLVRLNHHQEFEYVRRSDQQIKLRGYRIELEEINQTLTAHSGIKQAVTVLQGEDQEYVQIVSFVVTRSAQLTATQLRADIASTLPDYMLPKIVILEALPLTPNGKIDRNALPDHQRQTSEDYVSASNEVEEFLVELWQQLLKVESIGVHDDFFSLGGHSLLAIRGLQLLNEQLQLNIKLPDFFNQPTIKQLALVVEQALLEELDQISDEQADAMLNTGQ